MSKAKPMTDEERIAEIQKELAFYSGSNRAYAPPFIVDAEWLLATIAEDRRRIEAAEKVIEYAATGTTAQREVAISLYRKEWPKEET